MKKLAFTALAIAALLLLLWGMASSGFFGTEDLNFYQKNVVKNMKFACLSLGCLTAFWGLIGVIFHNKLSKWCSVQTILIALGLAVVVSMGLTCGLSLLSCYIDSDPARHPISYPLSGALGCLCLAGFGGLFFLYYKVRKKKPSVPGVVLEVVMSLAYCLPLMSLWALAHNILKNLNGI